MRCLSPLLLLLILGSCSPKKESVVVTSQSITESVYASVIIQPDSLYEAYSIVSGLLDKNLVEEGELVGKDQNLMQIINITPKLNTQNARLAYELALQNYQGNSAILNTLKDEIDAARLTYKNDSINYYRQANLWKQNIGSKAQYDSQKLKFELSKNALKLLEDKLKRTQNELKTAVEQTRNTYEAARVNTEDFTITSKINGKVYALYKEPGEIVMTHEPLAALGSADDFVINMLVDEVDIVKLRHNQDVLVSLDAYENQVFEASVSKIYPKKDQRNQTFTVEAIFKTPPEKLYAGLSGEANIVLTKEKEALCIPKSFLINGNQVLTEDGPVTIVKGIENMDYVEIVDGIEEHTRIYKE
jgi:HlyD family secretion protein